MHQTKPPEDEPPSYNVIAPYAPPDTGVPSAPPSYQLDTPILKGLPPGMEHLLQINQLIVKEKFTVSQGRNSTFDVLNHVGQRVFQAFQDVVCCGPLYDVKIKDNSGNDVLHLLESCGCTCTREMEVHCPPGYPVGFVKVHNNMMVTHLSIMNSSKQVALLILGPRFQNSIFGNVTYEVKSQDEQHVVGMIKMEGDHILVSFPLDLEVTLKAMLLSSSLYLDYFIKVSRSNLERRARQNS
ncbi:phospholipid scramblase 2-like isoform 1-T2 [Anomaloglossus baeobatrachus]|uniref:phospholipid scramblase 2-like n=1 Tax=Anomaloglossus baeobatrachus TaxID=238106 RepID=UPI003F50966B